MKECFKCGKNKALSEYYKHSEMADGHLNKCKECARKDVIKNRIKNVDYYREYDKSRMNEPQRIEAREKWANSEAGKESHMLAKVRWAAKNPEKDLEAKRKWRQANKQKVNAHTRVRRAVASGKLIKTPCIVCGNKKSQGHHEDYNKPLDVKWLCAACHGAEHKTINT